MKKRLPQFYYEHSLKGLEKLALNGVPFVKISPLYGADGLIHYLRWVITPRYDFNWPTKIRAFDFLGEETWRSTQVAEWLNISGREIGYSPASQSSKKAAGGAKVFSIASSPRYRPTNTLLIETTRAHRLVNAYMPDTLPDINQLKRFLVPGIQINETWVYPERMELFIQRVEKTGYAETSDLLYSPSNDIIACRLIGTRKGVNFLIHHFKTNDDLEGEPTIYTGGGTIKPHAFRKNRTRVLRKPNL